MIKNTDVLMFCDYKRNDSSNVKTIHTSRLHDSVKCYRNVTKQTNPLQVENLITNKSVVNLEAPRRIFKTQCVKISILANMTNF